MTGWLAMQRTLAPALIGLAMLVAGPVMAAPKQIVADLSNSRVDITSSYHGTELLLFGAYEGMPGDDIILVVQGPATDIIQRARPSGPASGSMSRQRSGNRHQVSITFSPPTICRQLPMNRALATPQSARCRGG